MHLESAIATARASRWLAHQDKEFQNAICGRMQLLLLAKGEPLFHVEDRAHNIFCLTDGLAVASVVHPVLGSISAHVFRSGQWFGEPAALGRRPRIMSVQARMPCELIVLTRTAIEELLRENPSFSWNLFNLMSANTEAYLHHAVDLLLHDPKLRLCSRLLTFAGRLLDYLPPSPVIIPMSHEEIAVASCISRQTVHHLLTGLVKDGICELGYREIVIRDMGALAEIVAGDVAAEMQARS